MQIKRVEGIDIKPLAYNSTMLEMVESEKSSLSFYSLFLCSVLHCTCRTIKKINSSVQHLLDFSYIISVKTMLIKRMN